MSAAKPNPGPPDMNGLTGDWAKLQNLRRGDTPPGREPESEERDDQEQPPPGRRQSRPGRSRGGKKPPPSAEDAIPTTIRFDPAESSDIDLFVLTLRDEAHRRNLDKSEVFRELIRMGMEHEPTRKALLRRLR